MSRFKKPPRGPQLPSASRRAGGRDVQVSQASLRRVHAAMPASWDVKILPRFENEVRKCGFRRWCEIVDFIARNPLDGTPLGALEDSTFTVSALGFTVTYTCLEVDQTVVFQDLSRDGQPSPTVDFDQVERRLEAGVKLAERVWRFLARITGDRSEVATIVVGEQIDLFFSDVHVCPNFARSHIEYLPGHRTSRSVGRRLSEAECCYRSEHWLVSMSDVSHSEISRPCARMPWRLVKRQQSLDIQALRLDRPRLVGSRSINTDGLRDQDKCHFWRKGHISSSSNVPRRDRFRTEASLHRHQPRVDVSAFECH